MRRGLSALLLVLAAPAGVAAQSIWLPPAEGRVVALEYVHPHAPAAVISSFTPTEPGPLLGAFYLGVAWPVWKGVRVLAEVPYAVSTGRASGCTDVYCAADADGDALGNPYLGVEGPLAGRVLRWQAGVRLPLQSVDGNSWDFGGGYAARAALETARAERDRAFQRNVPTATGLLELRTKVGRGTSVRAQLGSTLVHLRYHGWVLDPQTGIDVERRQDWVVEWRGAALLWQRAGPLLLNAGVFALSHQRYWDGPRVTDYEWGASAGLELGHFTPLVQARVPSYRPDATANEPPTREWWNLAVALQVRP